MAPGDDVTWFSVSWFAVYGVAPTCPARGVRRQYPTQLFFLLVDRSPWRSLSGRAPGSDLLADALEPCQTSEGYAKTSGVSGCSYYLLAFHGRSLDLPISTP